MKNNTKIDLDIANLKFLKSKLYDSYIESKKLNLNYIILYFLFFNLTFFLLSFGFVFFQSVSSGQTFLFNLIAIIVAFVFFKKHFFLKPKEGRMIFKVVSDILKRRDYLKKSKNLPLILKKSQNGHFEDSIKYRKYYNVIKEDIDSLIIQLTEYKREKRSFHVEELGEIRVSIE